MPRVLINGTFHLSTKNRREGSVVGQTRTMESSWALFKMEHYAIRTHGK